MHFFSWGKKKEGFFTVGLIDIGSSGIEVAIIQNNSIIFSAKKDLATSARDNIENFSQAIYKILTEVLSEVQKFSGSKPSTYHCILPAPLFVNGVKTLEIKKDTFFVIDNKLIQQTLSESVKNFLSDKSVLFPQFSGDTNRLIENEIFSTEANGYRVDNFLGIKTKNLKLVQGLSYGSNHLLKEIEKTIKASTQQEDIVFHTFPTVAFRAIDILVGRDRDDYLIIDAGGEFTDITVVHDRSLVTHFSFPYGFNFMRRGLAESLSTTPVEAVSTIKLYFQNKLADEARIKFETVIAKERAQWLKYFSEAFKKISETTFVFPTVFILGDELSTLFMQDFLRDPSLKELVFNKNDFRLSTNTALLNSSPIKTTMFSGASPFLNLAAPIFSSEK